MSGIQVSSLIHKNHVKKTESLKSMESQYRVLYPKLRTFYGSRFAMETVKGSFSGSPEMDALYKPIRATIPQRLILLCQFSQATAQVRSGLVSLPTISSVVTNPPSNGLL